MTSTLPLRPTLAGRITRLLPALAVAALAWSSVPAEAAFSQAALDAINAKLAEFANDKAQPGTVAKVPTVVTAKADDLVYAVYQVSLLPQFSNSTAARDLVETALTAIAGKARADKDKVAPRLVNAAIVGVGITSGADASQVVLGAVQANGTAKTALTSNGKAAVIGQALKSLAGVSNTDGGPLAGIAQSVAGFTSVTALQTVVINSLKPLGTSVSQVRSYIDAVLDTTVLPDATAKNNFAIKVAEGVASSGSTAGEVIGGRAQDIVGGTATATTDVQVTTFTQTAIKNPKLAKAILPIVGSTAFLLSASTTPQGFAQDLVGANGLGTKATAANRGAVAGGVIRSASAGQVNAIVDASLTGKTLTKAELSLYTGAASGSIGDLAGDLIAKVVSIADTVAPNDATTRKAIGTAALKGIATTSPRSGVVIAQRLVSASGSLFGTDAAKLDLAKALAKGVPTSAPTAGAAVAGVASTLSTLTPQTLADFGASVIKTSTKATLNIAKELAVVRPVNGLVPVVSDYKDFAVKMVQNTQITTATAPNVAAGIAVASITGTPGQLQIGNGQSPGDIAAAVAQATELLKAKAAVIAGAVALPIDVERIAHVGGRIAALYQNAGSTSKLPKLSSIGALATSLAKAINTKPFVTTVGRGDVLNGNITANTNALAAKGGRVDEMGELAAEMTRSAIGVITSNGTITTPNEALISSTITTIGTSVFKGLSAALLINGGNFGADLKDAAGDIAGAIAQTIQVVLGRVAATQALAVSLTRAGGPLELALVKAAKKFGYLVTAAFGEVRAATGNTGRLVAGGEALGVGEVGTGEFGKYEIGSFVEMETPVVNL